MHVIVSAYYKIPSKQPHNFYITHLQKFFSFLHNNPIIFFCEESTKKEIESFNIPLDNVNFIILPFKNLYEISGINEEMWNKTWELDPEKKYHTPELGLVWCCKKEFVRLATNFDTNATWFIWVDAGCIRNISWKESCKNFTKRRLSSLTPGVYLQLINPLESKDFYKYPDVFIAGAIIIFHKNYILPYKELYTKTLLQYYTNNTAFIMDQYIMASMFKENHVWLHAIPCIESIDVWFFFLDWL